VENIAALLREDLDGDGEITESEFIVLMLKKLKCKAEPHILALLTDQFHLIDVTNDGTLSLKVSRRCWFAAENLLTTPRRILTLRRS
jgi:Ca2+-binding EF-hand superfamily protein